MKIVIAAGASGGHVYPALATAAVLRKHGHDVIFVGGDRLEARVVPEAGFPFHGLPVRRPPSVRIELLTPRGLVAMASIGRATLRAGRLLGSIRPDVVLGMGGFAGVPVTLAAARAKLPIVLHEQNAHLSLAQRLPLRWARVLAIGLPLQEDVAHPRIELVGNPVRSSIASLHALSDDDRAARRADARRRLGLEPDVTTLLVLGGSLGSGPLNDLAPRLALPGGVQVLHICGPSHGSDVLSAWEGSAVHARVVDFLETIEDAYLAADLALSRSGASVVSELALVRLPAVLVPLPTLARGDQEANARVLERAGGAVVVLQSSPDLEDRVRSDVLRLLREPMTRASMAASAASIAAPDAARRLADVVTDVASHAGRPR